MVQFIKECFITFLRIVIADTLTILSLLVIFSEKAKEWLAVFGISGAIIIILMGFIVSVTYNLYLFFNRNMHYGSFREKVNSLADGSLGQIDGVALKDEFDRMSKQNVNNMFKLFCILFPYPNENIRVSIHYYDYSIIDGKEYLVKNRNYCYETDNHPIDYTLEKIDIDSKGMVVCKAFKENAVIFENITQEHISQYDESIVNHVDTNIKWVLAAPVWIEDEPIESNRKGVLCLFSKLDIVVDDENLSKLKMMCLILSSCISPLV